MPPGPWCVTARSEQPVLITGAFGQVGKRCTEILLARGRTVVATDLRTDAVAAAVGELARGKHPGALTTVYADLLDAAAISDLVAEHEPSAIIHLAGMLFPGVVPQSASGQARQRRRHHQSGAGRRIPVRAAAAVFASSTAVHG
jgi:hypothetical protein